MKSNLSTDLTELEYIAVGFLSREPLSEGGLSLQLRLIPNQWQPRSESITPMLNKLKRKKLLVGKTSATSSYSSATVYVLTAKGSKLLNNWIRQVDRHEVM